MKLPQINLASLPDLDVLTSVFGAIKRASGADDTIIVLAAIVYESAPPGGGLI
jgi:hypothetical protein